MSTHSTRTMLPSSAVIDKMDELGSFEWEREKKKDIDTDVVYIF